MVVEAAQSGRCAPKVQSTGVEKWHLDRLITCRSRVQVPLPAPKYARQRCRKMISDAGSIPAESTKGSKMGESAVVSPASLNMPCGYLASFCGLVTVSTGAQAEAVNNSFAHYPYMVGQKQLPNQWRLRLLPKNSNPGVRGLPL